MNAHVRQEEKSEKKTVVEGQAQAHPAAEAGRPPDCDRVERIVASGRPQRRAELLVPKRPRCAIGIARGSSAGDSAPRGKLAMTKGVARNPVK